MSFRHEQELCSSETTETLTPWIGQNNCQLLIVFWRQLFFSPPIQEITFPAELARDADAATVFLAYPLEASKCQEGASE